MVEHSCFGRGLCFLLQLGDLLHDDIEAAMALDGVPIGIGAGRPQESRSRGGLPLGAGCTELEPPGAVEMFPLPGHRHLDNHLRMLPVTCRLDLPVDSACSPERGDSRLSCGGASRPCRATYCDLSYRSGNSCSRSCPTRFLRRP